MSVSRACVELAEGDLGDLSGLSAMVLGTGDAGGLAAKGLRSSGVSDITVVNRTHHRAVELAKTLSGHAVTLPEMGVPRGRLVEGVSSSHVTSWNTHKWMLVSAG